MLMLSSCIALLPARHKCIPKLSCQRVHALSHVSSVVVMCVAIHMANSEIHPHYNNSPLCGSFRCFSFLFTSSSRSSKGKQFDPKVNSCILHKFHSSHLLPGVSLSQIISGANQLHFPLFPNGSPLGSPGPLGDLFGDLGPLFMFWVPFFSNLD